MRPRQDANKTAGCKLLLSTRTGEARANTKQTGFESPLRQRPLKALAQGAALKLFRRNQDCPLSGGRHRQREVSGRLAGSAGVMFSVLKAFGVQNFVESLLTPDGAAARARFSPCLLSVHGWSL